MTPRRFDIHFLGEHLMAIAPTPQKEGPNVGQASGLLNPLIALNLLKGSKIVPENRPFAPKTK